MQTYAHYFWSYAIFRKKPWAHEVAGFSMFPDMPYFMAYLATWGNVGSGGRAGYREGILHVVANGTHSVLLLAIASSIVILLKKQNFYPMMIGWLFHQLGDHFTHVTDAYPQLWPLYNYRFKSVISYWDPAYHGKLFNQLNHLLMFPVLCLLLSGWLRNTYRMKKLNAGMDPP